MYHIGYLVGVVCGAAVGIILLLVILKLTKKDGKIRCRYDERQQLVRGKGFKYSFFTLMAYCLVYGAISNGVERLFIDTFSAMFLGVAVSVAVYASYCIWNEGYISLNENPKRVVIAFVIIGAANYALGIRQIVENGFFENGMVTFRCANLLCGILMTVICIVMAVKWMFDRREAE